MPLHIDDTASQAATQAAAAVAGHELTGHGGCLLTQRQLGTENVLILDGDSLTAAGSWQAYLVTKSTFTTTTTAVSGKLSSYLHETAPSRVDALVTRASRHKVVVLWCGANDIASNGFAWDTYANIRSYCQERQLTGAKVIICTVISRTGCEVQKNQINYLLRRYWSDFADGLVDLASIAALGADGSCDNTTYFHPDKTHLVTAGYALVGAAVGPVIDSITAEPTTDVVAAPVWTHSLPIGAVYSGGILTAAARISLGIAADAAALGLTVASENITAIAAAGVAGNPNGSYCILRIPASGQLCRIAVKGVGSINAFIDWGAGGAIETVAINATTATTIEHDYGSTGARTILIAGAISSFESSYSGGYTVFGGRITGLCHDLTILVLTGNNTVGGDITSAKKITNITVQSSTTMPLYADVTDWRSLTSAFIASTGTWSGYVGNLNVGHFLIQSPNTIVGWEQMALQSTGLYRLSILGGYPLAYWDVNGILGAVWTNKDRPKLGATRILSLNPTGSSAPNGSGATWKALLSEYHSPDNNLAYPIWTITTAT